MGILSGPAIREALRSGDIHIDPFIDAHVGPNSYDLRLADTLLVYTDYPLDPKKENVSASMLIPDPDGFRLEPRLLYLAATMEAAGSDKYVPCIEGRSSMARLGISPHVSAGFGDHGFKSHWTLEITVTHPVMVYRGMRICQIFFHELTGDHQPYKGKYGNTSDPVASKSFQDFL